LGPNLARWHGTLSKSQAQAGEVGIIKTFRARELILSPEAKSCIRY